MSATPEQMLKGATQVILGHLFLGSESSPGKCCVKLIEEALLFFSQSQVSEAVAAERERCANVAFRFDGGDAHPKYDWVATKAAIGHKILNPSPEAGKSAIELDKEILADIDKINSEDEAGKL